MTNFAHNPHSDPWQWRYAKYEDLHQLVDLTEHYFEQEIDQIYTPDREYYTHQLAQAIISQTYDPGLHMIAVALIQDQIAAYGWVSHAPQALWSRDTTAEARIAHCDLTLPVRQRISLTYQIIDQWLLWAQITGHKVLISSTVRSEQHAFLRLHERLGFTIRGSIAYKRL